MSDALATNIRRDNSLYLRRMPHQGQVKPVSYYAVESNQHVGLQVYNCTEAHIRVILSERWVPSRSFSKQYYISEMKNVMSKYSVKGLGRYFATVTLKKLKLFNIFTFTTIIIIMIKWCLLLLSRKGGERAGV